MVLRISPSGPLAPMSPILSITSIGFPQIDIAPPGNATGESSLFFYPIPPTPARWSVIPNPYNYPDPEAPFSPEWIPDWAFSHVRIGRYDLEMHDYDPFIEPGVKGIEIVLGMSYLKATLVPVAIGVSLDLVLLEQGENHFNVWESIPPPPPPPP